MRGTIRSTDLSLRAFHGSVRQVRMAFTVAVMRPEEIRRVLPAGVT